MARGWIILLILVAHSLHNCTSSSRLRSTTKSDSYATPTSSTTSIEWWQILRPSGSGTLFDILGDLKLYLRTIDMDGNHLHSCYEYKILNQDGVISAFNTFCMPLIVVSGIRKCSTSALYNLLSQYPGAIKIPNKENCVLKKTSIIDYFNSLPTHIEKGQLFVDGCIEVNSNVLVRRMLREPNTFYLLLTRDYADWIWSAYNYWCSEEYDGECKKRTVDPATALRSPELLHEIVVKTARGEAVKSPLKVALQPCDLGKDRYAKLVSQFLAKFPVDDCLVLASEELEQSPATVWNRIAAAIGLSTDHPHLQQFKEVRYNAQIGGRNTTGFSKTVNASTFQPGLYEVSRFKPMLNETRDFLHSCWASDCVYTSIVTRHSYAACMDEAKKYQRIGSGLVYLDKHVKDVTHNKNVHKYLNNVELLRTNQTDKLRSFLDRLSDKSSCPASASRDRSDTALDRNAQSNGGSGGSGGRSVKVGGSAENVLVLTTSPDDAQYLLQLLHRVIGDEDSTALLLNTLHDELHPSSDRVRAHSESKPLQLQKELPPCESTASSGVVTFVHPSHVVKAETTLGGRAHYTLHRSVVTAALPSNELCSLHSHDKPTQYSKVVVISRDILAATWVEYCRLYGFRAGLSEEMLYRFNWAKWDAEALGVLNTVITVEKSDISTRNGSISDGVGSGHSKGVHSATSTSKNSSGHVGVHDGKRVLSTASTGLNHDLSHKTGTQTSAHHHNNSATGLGSKTSVPHSVPKPELKSAHVSAMAHNTSGVNASTPAPVRVSFSQADLSAFTAASQYFWTAEQTLSLLAAVDTTARRIHPIPPPCDSGGISCGNKRYNIIVKDGNSYNAAAAAAASAASGTTALGGSDNFHSSGSSSFDNVVTVSREDLLYAEHRESVAAQLLRFIGHNLTSSVSSVASSVPVSAAQLIACAYTQVPLSNVSLRYEYLQLAKYHHIAYSSDSLICSLRKNLTGIDQNNKGAGLLFSPDFSSLFSRKINCDIGSNSDSGNSDSGSSNNIDKTTSISFPKLSSKCVVRYGDSTYRLRPSKSGPFALLALPSQETDDVRLLLEHGSGIHTGSYVTNNSATKLFAREDECSVLHSVLFLDARDAVVVRSTKPDHSVFFNVTHKTTVSSQTAVSGYRNKKAAAVSEETKCRGSGILGFNRGVVLTADPLLTLFREYQKRTVATAGHTDPTDKQTMKSAAKTAGSTSAVIEDYLDILHALTVTDLLNFPSELLSKLQNTAEITSSQFVIVSYPALVAVNSTLLLNSYENSNKSDTSSSGVTTLKNVLSFVELAKPYPERVECAYAYMTASRPSYRDLVSELQQMDAFYSDRKELVCKLSTELDKILTFNGTKKLKFNYYRLYSELSC